MLLQLLALGLGIFGRKFSRSLGFLGRHPKVVKCMSIIIACLIALFVIGRMLENARADENWVILLNVIIVLATIGGINQVLVK